MAFSNRIRYCYYMSGVLANQASDPICGVCRAFANTVRAVEDEIGELERHPEELKSLGPEMSGLLSRAKMVIASLNPPADAEGQKKAGRCKMPEGVCFVKYSKGIIERIRQ